jgi:hypothetical protein
VRNVSILADDDSRVDAHAGAASIAASFGGSAGVAVSIGVSLSRNIIDTVVLASLRGAQLDAKGTVDVKGTSSASITVKAWAASVGAGFGGAAGVGVSGAGASALNVILGDVFAKVDDSAIRAASDVSVNAQATNRITALIISASLGVGGGGSAGVGASIGVALARNYIGYDPEGFDGDVTYTSGTSKPTQIKKGDLIRLAANSGPRANEVYEYIGSDTLKATTKDGKVQELILIQDYADTKKWKQRVGTSANRIIASVNNASITALDDDTLTLDLSVKADTAQTIESQIVSGSVALAGGGAAGVALSGAGAAASNQVGSQTQAAITNTTGKGVDVDGAIVVDAQDRSTIKTTVTAVSVAASFGAAGASVALSVSLADNQINSTITALVDKALLKSADSITVNSYDKAKIDSSSTAVAVAVLPLLGPTVTTGGDM